MSIASAGLPSDPPRYRIAGQVPATKNDGAYIPAYNFVSYDVGWLEEDAIKSLDRLASVLPQGTTMELQSTRDEWVMVEGGWRSVKKPPARDDRLDQP